MSSTDLRNVLNNQGSDSEDTQSEGEEEAKEGRLVVQERQIKKLKHKNEALVMTNRLLERCTTTTETTVDALQKLSASQSAQMQGNALIDLVVAQYGPFANHARLILQDMETFKLCYSSDVAKKFPAHKGEPSQEKLNEFRNNYLLRAMLERIKTGAYSEPFNGARMKIQSKKPTKRPRLGDDEVDEKEAKRRYDVSRRAAMKAAITQQQRLAKQQILATRAGVVVPVDADAVQVP